MKARGRPPSAVPKNRNSRSVAGPFMSVASLARVIPCDYMVFLKDDKESILWNGIAWTLLYYPYIEKYGNLPVVKFETSYYNDEVYITVTKDRGCHGLG